MGTGKQGLSTKTPSACAVSQCTAHQELLVHVCVYLYVCMHVCACVFLLTEKSPLSLQTVHDQPSLLHQNSYSSLHYLQTPPTTLPGPVLADKCETIIYGHQQSGTHQLFQPREVWHESCQFIREGLQPAVIKP